MLQRHPLIRTFAFLFAAFVAALPDAAAVLEARAEAAVVASQAQIHVEADGIVDHVFAHPDDCVLCHVLSALYSAPAPAERPVAIRVVVRPADPPVDGAREVRELARHSRAPPSV
ncbi:MAG TPA: hypothetical protein VFG84_08945 [Gemmatimonadaceae bacterium]|nr:hypothetical protein [Gemmatimonadaceae bacterium]